MATTTPARRFSYDGFISYRHNLRDQAIADRLQAALHGFARPLWKLRAVRLYRDHTSLEASEDLWASIRQALDASAYLVVLASPESAASPWVKREIDYWLEHRGQSGLVIVLTRGTLLWDADRGGFDPTASDVLPSDVLDRFTGEPLWLDLTWLDDGASRATTSEPRFLDAVATLSATLQGRPKDEIAGDDVRQLRLRRRLATGAVGLISIGFIAAVVFALNFLEQRDVAREQQAEAERQRDAALNQESRSLAALADAAIRSGDAVTGMLLALRGVPQPSEKGDENRFANRPYSLEAMNALASALWSKREQRLFRGHEGSLVAATLSSDGQTLLTGSLDDTIRLWHADTGESFERHSYYDGLQAVGFGPHERSIFAAAYSGIFGARYVASLVDAGTGSKVGAGTRKSRPEVRNLGPLTAANLSPDGRFILTASGSTLLKTELVARIWDTETDDEPVVLRGHTGVITAARFSPSGKRVLTGSTDRTLRFWDAATGREMDLTLKIDSTPIAVDFDLERHRAVAGLSDGDAIVWEIASGNVIHRLRRHTEAVYDAKFNLDGSRIVTASRDGTARIWDPVEGRLLATLAGHQGEGGIKTAEFGRDGKVLVTAGADATARLWDVSPDRYHRVLRGHRDWVMSASFSADDDLILTGAGDGTWRLFNARSGEQEGSKKAHEALVSSANFSPDGKTILTASDDHTAALWNAESDEMIRQFIGHAERVIVAKFSDDGKRLVTGSSDDTARIWDTDACRETIILLGHKGDVIGADFSPNGEFVATASADQTVALWNSNTGQRIHPFEGHKTEINSVQFNADGSKIVTSSGALYTAGDDNTVRIWDVEQRKEIVRLEGHERDVLSAVFGPNGDRILSASRDGTARLWDVQSGAQLLALEGDKTEVTSANFSRDGSWIVTSSVGGTVRLWFVGKDMVDFIEHACAALPRDLTSAQMRLYGIDPDADWPCKTEAASLWPHTASAE